MERENSEQQFAETVARNCCVCCAGDVMSVQLVDTEPASVAADERPQSDVVRGEDEDTEGWWLCAVCPLPCCVCLKDVLL